MARSVADEVALSKKRKNSLADARFREKDNSFGVGRERRCSHRERRRGAGKENSD